LSNHWRHIVGSVVLLGVALLLFALPGDPGIADLVSWTGIFLVALAVWVWRAPLGLTGIGPLSWLPVKQQEPEKTDDEQKPTGALGPTEDMESTRPRDENQEPWLQAASGLEFRDLKAAALPIIADWNLAEENEKD
jgi:hypothetical protein